MKEEKKKICSLKISLFPYDYIKNSFLLNKTNYLVVRALICVDILLVWHRIRTNYIICEVH